MDALKSAKNSTYDGARPLFRVRFFDESDELQEQFIRSTSLTSDLTIFIARPSVSSSRNSYAPRVSLRILYNSLLFTSFRITCIIDQLSTFLRAVSTSPISPVGSTPLLTSAQRERLPNPTADLHWCDWKGAITDVFSRNAKQWPDRPCVVTVFASLGIQPDPGEADFLLWKY